MLFADLATASEHLAATPKRGEKAQIIADVLRRLAPDEVAAAVGFLTGAPVQGRIGVGWATIRSVQPEPATTASLTVGDVDRAITSLAALSGSGVVAARRSLLLDVLGRATGPEQRLLWSVLGGELRHGALDGVMVEAIAKGAAVPIAAVRRAHMLAGDLGATAAAALSGGAAALEAVAMSTGRAVQPMLASPAEDVAAALAAPGSASVEWKLDGARIQAHRRDGEVRLFTRNLNEVTGRLGAVVGLVAGLPGGDLVLDGEVLGVDDEGQPRRFQDTMGDFSADFPTQRGAGLSAYFFDVLHAGDGPIVDEPLAVRRDVLATVVPSSARLPSLVTADADEATAFLDRAVAAGHEGVMVKALESRYDAGRRGGQWRKVKPVHTLDLVVLAAEWGHGRRTGWLSNLHLGARGDGGEWVMVGKTFKGLTDQLLTWQTEALQAIAVGTESGYVVHVRPELVVEIALDGVQASTRYPGGVALRFARVRRYRPDKSPADADHIQTVRAMLR
ncbi:ATP-dependent DNA ligase [soil metagenome]